MVGGFWRSVIGVWWFERVVLLMVGGCWRSGVVVGQLMLEKFFCWICGLSRKNGM